MSMMIRSQKMVPEVYPAGSRDFQLLCHLIDAIYNGIKFDTDSIININDVGKIQSNLLPLLQTKLGFFSRKEFNDKEIRYILTAFPSLVKMKGSLAAIKGLLNVCLKLSDIDGAFTISYSDKPTIINGVEIDAHTLIVGVNKILKTLDILNEVAKYILPAGFNFYIYFYGDVTSYDEILLNQDVKLLYSSSNINAAVRGSTQLYSDELLDTLLGSVGVAWINSGDDKLDDRFLGIFDTVSELPLTASFEDIALADNDLYFYDNDWHKINFLGTVQSPAVIASPQDYDLVATLNRQLYKVYYNGVEIDVVYLGVYDSLDSVILPEESSTINFLVNVSSVSEYKLMLAGQSDWEDVTYLGYYSNTQTQYDSSEFPVDEYAVVIVNGANYYLRLNGVWEIYTNTMYVLKTYLNGTD